MKKTLLTVVLSVMVTAGLFVWFNRGASNEALPMPLLESDLLSQEDTKVYKSDNRKRSLENSTIDDQVESSEEEKSIARGLFALESLAGTIMQQKRASELKKLAALLNLSPEQVAAIEAKKLTVFTVKNLQDVLTEEQLAAYRAYRNEKKAKRIEASALREYADMQEHVNLTDDQKEAVYAILHERKSRKAPPIPKEEIDTQSMESTLDAIAEITAQQNAELIEDLSEVLTPSQVTQYQQRLDEKQELAKSANKMLWSEKGSVLDLLMSGANAKE